MSESMIDLVYVTTPLDDEADRQAVDDAWAEGGENVPAEVVWAELGLVKIAEPTSEEGAERPFRRIA